MIFTRNGTVKKLNQTAEDPCPNNTGAGGNGSNHNNVTSGAGGSGGSGNGKGNGGYASSTGTGGYGSGGVSNGNDDGLRNPDQGGDSRNPLVNDNYSKRPYNGDSPLTFNPNNGTINIIVNTNANTQLVDKHSTRYDSRSPYRPDFYSDRTGPGPKFNGLDDDILQCKNNDDCSDVGTHYSCIKRRCIIEHCSDDSECPGGRR